MRLAQPLFIYTLLIGIPLTIILFWLVFKLREKAKKRFGNLDLIQKLSSSYSPTKQKLKVFVLVLGLFLLGCWDGSVNPLHNAKFDSFILCFVH